MVGLCKRDNECHKIEIIYNYYAVFFKFVVMPSLKMCVYIPMPTHCTITCFGFRAKRRDGVKCGLFSIHAPLRQITLRVGRAAVKCTGES